MSIFAKARADAEKRNARLAKAVAERPPQRTVTAGEVMAQSAKLKQLRDPAFLEVQRIIQIPLWQDMDAAEQDHFQRQNVLAVAYEKGFRLFECQAEALVAYDNVGGGFFPIAAGHGKTAIAAMIAERAYRKGIRKSMLLVPPEVYAQLVTRDLPWLRTKVTLSVPFLKLGEIGKSRRQALASSDVAGCYIVPYSMLSTPDASDTLDGIDPDLVIADEVHLLKNAEAARTKRMRRLFEKKDGIELVGMSGTVTNKSVLDYWHVIKTALGANCPLPMTKSLALQWAGLLDAEVSRNEMGSATEVSGPVSQPIMPLVRWAQEQFPEHEGGFPENVRGVRAAYQKRLLSIPGVVTVKGDQLGTNLVVTTRPVDSGPGEELQALMDQVTEQWLTPSGDELEHPMNQYSWNIQLTAGAYNHLYWPEADDLARELGVPLDRAREILVRSQDAHQLQNLYHSTARKWLRNRSKPGLDQPLQLMGDMNRNGAKNVGDDLYGAYIAAVEANAFEGIIDRRSKPVRVDSYKVDEAVRWAKTLPKSKGGIIWVWHREIGKWAHEKLVQVLGEDRAMHCPRGREANVAIADPANKAKVVVASIRSHGTGKNLQHFEHQYMLEWPRPADTAEQLLARLHRKGQQADTVHAILNTTTMVDQMNFAATLNDSQYIAGTTTDQRLLTAVYDPPPVTYSYDTLRRAGLDPKRLTGQQLELLRERFGNPVD